MGLFFLGLLLGRPAVAEVVVQAVAGSPACCGCPCADEEAPGVGAVGGCDDEHGLGCADACDHCVCHMALLAVLPPLPPALRLLTERGDRRTHLPEAPISAEPGTLLRPPRA